MWDQTREAHYNPPPHSCQGTLEFRLPSPPESTFPLLFLLKLESLWVWPCLPRPSPGRFDCSRIKISAYPSWF